MDEAQAGRVSKMSALARECYSGLAEYYAEIRLEALALCGRVGGQGYVLTPCLCQGGIVKVRVASNELDELGDVVLWQLPEAVEDEIGIGRASKGKAGDRGSIALGTCVVRGCLSGLGTPALAFSVIVAFSLVNGCAGCADGRAAVTLWTKTSAREQPTRL